MRGRFFHCPRAYSGLWYYLFAPRLPRFQGSCVLVRVPEIFQVTWVFWISSRHYAGCRIIYTALEETRRTSQCLGKVQVGERERGRETERTERERERREREQRREKRERDREEREEREMREGDIDTEGAEEGDRENERQ